VFTAAEFVAVCYVFSARSAVRWQFPAGVYVVVVRRVSTAIRGVRWSALVVCGYFDVEHLIFHAVITLSCCTPVIKSLAVVANVVNWLGLAPELPPPDICVPLATV